MKVILITIVLFLAGCGTVPKYNPIDTNQIPATVEVEIEIEEPVSIDPPRYAR